MSAPVFDSRWRNLPDYILGVTREIWEDRGIDTLNDHYAPDVIVRSPAGVTRGNQAVIASTMASIHEFPDRELLGEDVIWSEHTSGWLSSHRLISQATHQGDGMFGAATGRRFSVRIIADCAVRNSQIFDEWLVRDVGGIARQLGTEPRAMAQHQIDLEGGPSSCRRPLMPDQDAEGGYTGAGNDNPWGARYADALQTMMRGGFSVIAREYDRACQLDYAGGASGYSHAFADQFWLGLRASFPSAAFNVAHCIGREDPLMPPRAALRWSLDGKHDGWGLFGAPSGAQVHVMGLSHAEFGPRGIRRECALIDEVAIWKQILIHLGGQ